MKKIIFLSMLCALHIFTVGAVTKGLKFRSSKYSNEPITIWLFRSRQDARGYAQILVDIVAYKEKSKKDMSWIDKIWNYVLIPAASAVGLSGPVKGAKKGSDWFAGWVDDKTLESKYGDQQAAYVKNMPKPFTLKPGESKQFTAQQVKAMGPFSNADEMGMLAFDKNENLLYYGPVPQAADIVVLGLSRKGAIGVGFNEENYDFSNVKPDSRANFVSENWVAVSGIILDETGVRDYMQKQQEGIAPASGITIKQVKDFLKLN